MRKPGHSVYVTDAKDLPSFLEPDGPLPSSVIRFTEYLGSIIAVLVEKKPFPTGAKGPRRK